MHPDPDDQNTLHDHYACSVPTLCVTTAIGRAYARRRITRMIRRECAEKGYTPTGPLCFHFGLVDGRSAVIAHFTARDALADAYAETETGK